MNTLQLCRAVDHLDALHYMHTNMLRVPLMHVVDSRDVQASVAPMSETLRTCRARGRSLAGSLHGRGHAGPRTGPTHRTREATSLSAVTRLIPYSCTGYMPLMRGIVLVELWAGCS